MPRSCRAWSAGERVIVSEVSAGQSDAAGGMPHPMGM